MWFVCKLWVKNTLAGWCGWSAELLEEWQRQLATCPTCGRSRYYGAPCQPGG